MKRKDVPRSGAGTFFFGEKGTKKPPALFGLDPSFCRWLVRQVSGRRCSGGTAKRRARKLAVESLRLSALHPMAYDDL